MRTLSPARISTPDRANGGMSPPFSAAAAVQDLTLAAIASGDDVEQQRAPSDASLQLGMARLTVRRLRPRPRVHVLQDRIDGADQPGEALQDGAGIDRDELAALFAGIHRD